MPEPLPDQPAIRILLRPLASNVPVDQRLKRLLKYALRCCSLRCVDCRDAPDQEHMPAREEQP